MVEVIRFGSVVMLEYEVTGMLEYVITGMLEYVISVMLENVVTGKLENLVTVRSYFIAVSFQMLTTNSCPIDHFSLSQFSETYFFYFFLA